MTLEPLLIVPHVEATGTWQRKRVDGVVTLLLFADEGQLHDEHGRHVSVPWTTLTDATWERETLELHTADDIVKLRGPSALSRAWGVVVEQSCPLPQVTRGMRTLGTTSGGAAELQARFFGPLLSARRRLQEPDAIERRVSQFDAVALTQRLTSAIAEFADDRHRDDPPRRRALEAHLEEALEPLLLQLNALQETTEALHKASAGNRFVEWRSWTRRLRRVFLEADRAWAHMIPHLKPR